MYRRAVPDYQPLTGNPPQQMLQEANHVFSLEGALLLHHVKLALQAHGADHREMIARARERVSLAGRASGPPGRSYEPPRAAGRSPTGPQTVRSYPPLWHFFQFRLAFLFPTLYCLLVSLVRPTHRFLQGEPQRPHQPADRRRMVTDAELLADLTAATRAQVHTSPLKP